MTAQQAALSSSALFIESGASCGVFIIPRERDKPGPRNPGFQLMDSQDNHPNNPSIRQGPLSAVDGL
jgi:hypothetical protein